MRSILVAVSFFFLAGCASIVSHGPQVVTINSSPSGANMTLCNARTGQRMATGRTPYTVTLDRGQGYFKAARYSVKCEKIGYQPAQQSLTASLNGWYWGNIIFGGIIGMFIVDPATGAMWSLHEKNVVINLSPIAMSQVKTPEIMGR